MPKIINRCSWCIGDALYEKYHDEEWGVPVSDVAELFERLVLEGMQAGLSWLTVLKKRERMRERFFGFSVDDIAAVDDATVDDWLLDPGIIRHRGKIAAMINNAKIVRGREDFSEWLWGFAPAEPVGPAALDAIPATTPESTAMSRALKQVGFAFVGPTTCYAFMQSVGMVNDHVADCWRQPQCAALRR